ncbi:MAG: HD domain-containing protein [Chloroflexi bacterium]|nr:HD domain-containing protein [Chloroflexota bacterium]
MVYAVLTMAPLLDEAIDLTKALAMAALHDLPEGLTTDIPVPAWRYLPSGIKIEVERGVMQEMLGETAVASQWMAWWEELYAAESAEARLVHDADKIDMFIQAWVYARQMGKPAVGRILGHALHLSLSADAGCLRGAANVKPHRREAQPTFLTFHATRPVYAGKMKIWEQSAAGVVLAVRMLNGLLAFKQPTLL